MFNAKNTETTLRENNSFNGRKIDELPETIERYHEITALLQRNLIKGGQRYERWVMEKFSSIIKSSTDQQFT
jgi:hypothetical protein